MPSRASKRCSLGRQAERSRFSKRLAAFGRREALSRVSTLTLESARYALAVANRESAAALDAMISAQGSAESVDRVKRADAAVVRAQEVVAAMSPRVPVTHASQQHHKRGSRRHG